MFVVIVVVNCGLLIVGQGERRPKRPPNEHKKLAQQKVKLINVQLMVDS